MNFYLHNGLTEIADRGGSSDAGFVKLPSPINTGLTKTNLACGWLEMYERLDNGFLAKCLVCGKLLKMTNRSVKALITHLNKHPDFKTLFEQLEERRMSGSGDTAYVVENAYLETYVNFNHLEKSFVNKETQVNFEKHENEIISYVNEEIRAERDGLAKFAVELIQTLNEIMAKDSAEHCVEWPKLPNSPKLHCLLLELDNGAKENAEIDQQISNREMEAEEEMEDIFGFLKHWFQLIGI